MSLQTDRHHLMSQCFHRQDALPAAQPTASKHWRRSIDRTWTNKPSETSMLWAIHNHTTSETANTEEKLSTWTWLHQKHRNKPVMEQVQALADISCSRYVPIATQPVHWLQIRPTVHNYGASRTFPPSYIQVNAEVRACGHRQTDTHTETTTHFASSTSRAQCNNGNKEIEDSRLCCWLQSFTEVTTERALTTAVHSQFNMNVYTAGDLRRMRLNYNRTRNVGQCPTWWQPCQT